MCFITVVSTMFLTVFTMRIGAKFNWGAIEVGVKMHPNPPADFKSGKVAALNFLKGQVMKLSKGKANPALVGRF